MFFFGLNFFYSHPKSDLVEFSVYEYPKVAPKNIRPISLKRQPLPEPKKNVAPPKRKVFGISKRTLTESSVSQNSKTDPVAVKAGNTLAKAPDTKILRPEDEESIPIPTEGYLVTEMPSIVTEVKIPYPEEARQKEVEGPVVMDLLIDRKGNVRDIQLIEGPSLSLSKAAVKAAKHIVFNPARIQDTPVAVRIRYVYRFVLES